LLEQLNVSLSIWHIICINANHSNKAIPWPLYGTAL
jgi:hypothetical protein